MVCAAIALVAPMIEVIITFPKAPDVGVQVISSVEYALFTRVYGISGAAAGDFSLAIANGHDGAVTAFVHVDAIAASAKNRKGKIRSVHLKRLLVIKVTDANIQRAFGQENLRHIVGQIQKGKASVVREADDRTAEMQFGAGAVVGPEFVARGHRPVNDRINPIVGAGGIERNVAARKCQASYPARGVVPVGPPALRSGNSQGPGHADETRPT